MVGISFLSRSAREQIGEGIVSERGSVYVFPKKESEFWCEEFDGLFGIEGREERCAHWQIEAPYGEIPDDVPSG